MYKWAEEALRLIEREQVNTLSAVPMMTRELLAHPNFADYDTEFGPLSAVAQQCILICPVR